MAFGTAFFTVAIPLIQIYNSLASQVFTNKDLPTIGDWWLWLVIFLLFLLVICFIEIRKLRLGQSKICWIDKHQLKYGRLPVLPQYLRLAAENYPIDKPIDKRMFIKTASGQYWNSLLPSKQEELLQLVEWTGRSREDYLAHMRMMLPKTPKGVDNIKWRDSPRK